MMSDWQTLFAARPLGERAVHLDFPGLGEPVWFASAGVDDLQTLPAERFLTPTEMTKAGTFKFGQPRVNFTLGRLAGKLAVAAAEFASRPLAPGLSPGGGKGEELARRLRSFEITNGANGGPIVCAGDLQSPTVVSKCIVDGDCKSPARGVSLSHVNGRGVAAAFGAGQQVGLDLELIDHRRAETVRKGVPLSAEEEAWLKGTALPEATTLLLLWTAREALGKALGCGLACKWETLATRLIQPAGEGVWSGRFLHQPQFRCLSWVGPEAVMSLAFEEAGVVRRGDTH